MVKYYEKPTSQEFMIFNIIRNRKKIKILDVSTRKLEILGKPLKRLKRQNFLFRPK